ncbi:MAG TPA: adenine phosphoribosyltransferase [Phycisphaerales bacterium]|nr:adenine phosphoribosyltransferase [Phycisphaerales bacterium]
MADCSIDLRTHVRDIPDWPKPGILFRDITPLLGDAAAFRAAIEALTAHYSGAGVQYVAAVEARGFIFGSAVAEKLRAGFIPIRKKGKLPYKTVRMTYDLEYGVDTLEAHADALRPGDRVLMVDDLLATGGTMAAACRLVENLGGKVVGISFLIELTALNGRSKLAGYDISRVIAY